MTNSPADGVSAGRFCGVGISMKERTLATLDQLARALCDGPMKQFKPCVSYEPILDFLTVWLEDVPYVAHPNGDFLDIHRAQDDGRVVGVKIRNARFAFEWDRGLVMTLSPIAPRPDTLCDKPRSRQVCVPKEWEAPRVGEHFRNTWGDMSGWTIAERTSECPVAAGVRACGGGAVSAYYSPTGVAPGWGPRPEYGRRGHLPYGTKKRGHGYRAWRFAREFPPLRERLADNRALVGDWSLEFRQRLREKSKTGIV